MSALRLAAQVAALAVATAAASVGHHGHIQQFLTAVHEALRQRIRRHRSRHAPSLLQVYFSKPQVHYEVWVQRKPRAIEIGLHFEGGREENQRWAGLLAGRAAHVQAKLGPEAELEQWTRSWTRLHETLPVEGSAWRPKEQLTEALARRVAARLARYIEVLEPVVREERARQRSARARAGARAGTSRRAGAPPRAQARRP
jgi:hypothetical protein